jgi:hypothetical protein
MTRSVIPRSDTRDPIQGIASHHHSVDMGMLETLRASSDRPVERLVSAPEPSRSASRARVRYNAALKLVRRVHMYLGLFLTPWVLLYGVSAFLFNHPEAFPDRDIRTLERSETAGTPLAAIPDAPTLAARLVDALNARAGGKTFRLRDPDSAMLSRPVTVTASGRQQKHAVRYDWHSGAVTIRSTEPARWSRQGQPDGEIVRLEDPPLERVVRGVVGLLNRLGIEADDASIRNSADLVFDLDAGGEHLRAAYNIQTERLSIRLVDDPSGILSNRRFLTGLHLASGYPSRPGVRWLWAVVVDLMAAAMVVWGCSGLLMWWQMKSCRRWGALALTASVIAATGLALAMHRVLSR